MIDIVRAEARAHELLEEISLFVRALRRAETRERTGSETIAQLLQFAGREIQRFVPRRFTEVLERIRRIHRQVGMLRDARLTDERFRKALFVMHVIETVTALHTE